MKTIFIIFILCGLNFAQEKKEIKEYRTSVTNKKLKVSTVTYKPEVKYQNVMVVKDVYKNGKLYKKAISYEKKPVVKYKRTRKNYYYPLIK